MRKKILILFGILLCIAFITSGIIHASGQAKKQVIQTNKDKLLTLAVQGQIAPAEPSRSYTTTWDGKSKMAIGIGGINYNLKIGDKTFGWAAGDRATVGVATVGTGESRGRSSWLTLTSIGNEVKVIGEGVLTQDGHCTYYPDKRWILTDTYPDKRRFRTLILYNRASSRRVDIGRFFAPRKLDGEFRCDLHPRWSRDGKSVCIDSVHEGSRQVYILDISDIVG